MINGFSIDVEDYWMNYLYNCLGLKIAPSSAVVNCTENMLSMLETYNTKATFFVVGQVAQNYPSLVRKIASSGHEIASHGQNHYEITKISRPQFKTEITESKKVLEDITGLAIKGHRATSFTITPKTKWALEELALAGYEYDSSVFPFQGRRYGWSGFCKDICLVKLESGLNITEIPMTVFSFLGNMFPSCGGGYLRHFPYIYTKWAINKTVKDRPFIVYIHPYDIDTESPPKQEIERIIEGAPFKAKLRHYTQIANRSTVQKKLDKLLQIYSFTSLINLIRQQEISCCFDMNTQTFISSRR